MFNVLQLVIRVIFISKNDSDNVFERCPLGEELAVAALEYDMLAKRKY